jgi:hypothetical protein
MDGVEYFNSHPLLHCPPVRSSNHDVPGAMGWPPKFEDENTVTVTKLKYIDLHSTYHDPKPCITISTLPRN